MNSRFLVLAVLGFFLIHCGDSEHEISYDGDGIRWQQMSIRLGWPQAYWQAFLDSSENSGKNRLYWEKHKILASVQENLCGTPLVTGVSLDVPSDANGDQPLQHVLKPEQLHALGIGLDENQAETFRRLGQCDSVAEPEIAVDKIARPSYFWRRMIRQIVREIF